jgi:hypothetical protein
VLSIVTEVAESTAEISEILRDMKSLQARFEGNRNLTTLSHVTLTIVDQDMEEMIQWLSPLEPSQKHVDVRSKRLEGTGDWSLQSEGFQKWCDDPFIDGSGFKTVLACYGIPGAGKTVIRYVYRVILYSRCDFDEMQFEGHRSSY